MSDEQIWSPLQIQILLHYYCSPADFRDGAFATAVQEAIDRFAEVDGLLTASSQPKYGAYEITARGRCLIEHILETPAPVQVWVIP